MDAERWVIFSLGSSAYDMPKCGCTEAHDKGQELSVITAKWQPLLNIIANHKGFFHLWIDIFDINSLFKKLTNIENGKGIKNKDFGRKIERDTKENRQNMVEE